MLRAVVDGWLIYGVPVVGWPVLCVRAHAVGDGPDGAWAEALPAPLARAVADWLRAHGARDLVLTALRRPDVPPDARPWRVRPVAAFRGIWTITDGLPEPVWVLAPRP